MLLGVMLVPTAARSAEDHSQHAGHAGHQGAVPDMDAEGKRLTSYNQRHEMSAADMAGLRRKVALYRSLTDRELEMNMNAMGPDYSWYVSDRILRGKVGVLILAHGVGQQSDRLMKQSLEPMSKSRPLTIGFGMSMMGSAHLQAAVDDLVAHGAKTIVLLDQGTTTPYNSLTRHWRYIFGMHTEASYLDVPKIKAPGVRFLWAGHFDDSPIITDIIHDNARSVSKKPAEEVVILVAHGPEDTKDNGPDLKILQTHVDRLKAKREFVDVKVINLQDDAIKPIRESNVRKLRSWVKQADAQGKRVIVVAVAAASFGVQTNIRNDLRGLKYTFADKGLTESPKFLQWLQAEVDSALAAAGGQAVKPSAGQRS
jgi:hypothetical protein